jgi:hypothetical protein
MMRALWLADVLRGAGLDVVETPGWQTRGRDFAATPLGIMAHHTASPVASTLATNLRVITTGNSVAPGPIAQTMLWRDGVWYVIAAGRANHAGRGSLPWLPAPDSGNQHLLAVEAVNNGVGELWAPPMLASFEIGTAAILRHLGHGADRATTHAEYAPGRKIDPAGPTGGRVATLPGRSTWDPNAWRQLVARWLAPPPPPVLPPPVPPLEVTKMLTIVGNDDDRNDPRRWVFDGGTSMRLLPDEAAYNQLLAYERVGMLKLYPFFSTLQSPHWMSTADRARFGCA